MLRVHFKNTKMSGFLLGNSQSSFFSKNRENSSIYSRTDLESHDFQGLHHRYNSNLGAGGLLYENGEELQVSLRLTAPTAIIHSTNYLLGTILHQLT